MQHSFLALFWIPLPLLHLVLPCASAAPLQTDSNPGPLLIDDFSDPEINALDHYHGGSGLGQFSEDEQKLTIATADVDGKGLVIFRNPLFFLTAMTMTDYFRLFRHQSKRNLHQPHAILRTLHPHRL